MSDNAPNQLIATGTLKVVPDTEAFDRFKADTDEWLTRTEARIQALFSAKAAVVQAVPEATPHDNKPVPATPDRLAAEPPPPPPASRIPEAFPDRPAVSEPAPPPPGSAAPPPPPDDQSEVVQQLVSLNSKMDLMGGEVAAIHTLLQEGA